jgi:1-acyl-sn-glycerol-3-phosphate acyltransferase
MVYPISKPFMKLILNRFIGKVNGLENVPKNRNFIVAANHDSYMDHFIIGVTLLKLLNKKIHFLAKKELFDTWIKKKFHEWAAAIPIDRRAGGKGALKVAVKALKHGEIIVIHPEGTRSYDGKLQEAKTGVARLALASEVPVLPIGLVGTFEILPKWKKIPKLRKAKVNIGKPMYFKEYYGMENDKKTIRLVTTRVMKEIAKLTGEEYNFD